MSDYKYTDRNSDKLCIGSGIPDGTVWIQINHGDTGWVEEVKNEDAPAVALAILEAAGIEGWNYRDDRLASAVVALTEHKRQQDAKAEREAEDAKVAAYRSHQFKAQKRNPNPEIEADTWKDMDEASKDLWRNEYRAARAFFEES